MAPEIGLRATGIDALGVVESTELGLLAAVFLILVLGIVVLHRTRDNAVSDADTSGQAASRESEGEETPSDYSADERLLTLIEEEGGRVRQRWLVDETGWSKTKVSRTLTSMDAEGDIVKIQLGRENLICLPEQTPLQTPSDEQ